MKRWLPWLCIPLILSVLVIANHYRNPGLLRDTDTAVLLQALDERHSPSSWFVSDWPLGNHFYRPVSTLSFEFDNAVHNGDAAGFGLTNALLAALCIWCLFWFLREVTESPWVSGAACGLFGVWHLWDVGSMASNACWFLAGLSWIGLLRGGLSSWKGCLESTVVWAFIAGQTNPVDSFSWRIIGWLPGRTASSMAVFALVALAAYARFERLSAGRSELRSPTSTDVPATKGTEVSGRTGKGVLAAWIVLCVTATALALGCYEQAVMLPAALLGVAVWGRIRGRLPHWTVHVLFWALLGLYLVLRSRFVPSSASGYQLQQFRNGPGVSMVLSDYVLPAFNSINTLLATLYGGALMWLMPGPWALSFSAVGNVWSWILARRSSLWPTVVGGFGLAAISFLPMAWLQPFGHYHYWPSAFRALYVVALLAVGAQVFVSAVSLPSLQAPRRQRPAPGSLLRP